MKKVIASFLLAIAVGMIFLASYGTHITLISSVEREVIGGDPVKYVTFFARYLVGLEIPTIPILFWGGLIVFIIAVVLMRRTRN